MSLDFDIGANLAFLRKANGFTQIEFAEVLGLSQPMVSDYERGELRLHAELIVEICRLFNITTDELLIGVTGSKNKL